MGRNKKRKHRQPQPRSALKKSKPAAGPGGDAAGTGMTGQKAGGILADGRWQGTAAILTLIGIVIAIILPFAIANYQRAQEEAANHAALDPSWTVRYNEPGDWSLIWTLSNGGPGVAHNLHVDYASPLTACTTIATGLGGGESPSEKPIDDSEEDIRHGADCAGGMALTAAESRTPGSLPLHIRELEDEGSALGLGLYSAVAREVAQDEMVWLELEFDSSPEFDASMLPLVDAFQESDQDAPEELKVLLEHFSSPRVGGTNISIRDTDYEAIRQAGE